MDALLEGGVETGCISMFYGEAGTGKSTLCLILARNIALQGKKVAYIDTEGVSMDRLRQICGDDFDAVAKKILFFAVNNFEEQERTVDKAIKLAEGNLDIGMNSDIVDSMSACITGLPQEWTIQGKGRTWQLRQQSSLLFQGPRTSRSFSLPRCTLI